MWFFLGRETVYVGKTILRGLCLILIQMVVMQERTFVLFLKLFIYSEIVMSPLSQDAEVHGLKPETVPDSEKVEILNIHKINIELQLFSSKTLL